VNIESPVKIGFSKVDPKTQHPMAERKIYISIISGKVRI
jgi:hypothetical protein